MLHEALCMTMEREEVYSQENFGISTGAHSLQSVTSCQVHAGQGEQLQQEPNEKALAHFLEEIFFF